MKKEIFYFKICVSIFPCIFIIRYFDNIRFVYFYSYCYSTAFSYYGMFVSLVLEFSSAGTMFLDNNLINICLNIPSSVVWCPHTNEFRFVFTSSCLWEGSCLIYVICVCLRSVVSTYTVLYFRFVCLRLV
jgi:hypothetical protein